MQLISMLRNKVNINWGKDIIAGIIVALVSIPISMGYTQIAGLPAVYGLYGSILPIFIFGLLTTSRQFVVGVDAMPAVMVGAMLAELGIASESKEAFSFVPLVSLVVALWFILFYIFKVGRIVKYISTPVMGGFISGVGATIILMQIPKLFGGAPGVGTIIPLVKNIVDELDNFNMLAFGLGLGTTVIILLCKKLIPKIPMTAIMLFVGALVQVMFKVDEHGVKLLPKVEAGVPKLYVPQLKVLGDNLSLILIEAFSIAIVIMAQTLLASGNYAIKYGDKLDNNTELIAYAGMNIASGIIGCAPINGSVSRSGIADTFGCRSQIMSIAAAITMVLVLLFATPLLGLLPVPILTGIVMAALVGILEIKLSRRLFVTSKSEFLIFLISMFGVLFFGTVNGVLIGCVLSFFEVAIRATTPPTAFIGRIPGQGNFYALTRNSNARPIKNAVIYRFGGNLFFANIDKFQKDIENAIKPDTRCVVVDARGIGNIDITATDRLVIFARMLKDKGIRFYLTEHDGTLNDMIRSQGGEVLMEENHVRRTITLALRDAGFEKPYTLEGEALELEKNEQDDQLEKLAEIEWAFGEDSEKWLERLAAREADMLELKLHGNTGMLTTMGVSTENSSTKDVSMTQNLDTEYYADIIDNLFGDARLHTVWGMLGRFDENEFWDYLEFKLEELAGEGRLNEAELNALELEIENRRIESEVHLQDINPSALKILRAHRNETRKHLRERHPEAYEHMHRLHLKRYKELVEHNPKLAEALKEVHDK